MAGTRLTVTLREPASAELLRRIREMPSVLDVTPCGRGDSLAPTVREMSALLEESADVDETAYLLESLPGIRSVSE